MKKEQDTIKILENSKKVSLSNSERDSIKFTLLEHAQKSLTYERKPSLSTWVTRVVPSFAVFILIFIGTAHVSQDSLPGDPLYAMKVNVVEEIVATSKFDRVDRTEYEISRMETRLQELWTISETDPAPETEELAAIMEEIDEHADFVELTITETEETEMSHEEKIEALTKLNGYAKAQAQIVDEHSVLSSISEEIHANEDDISDSLENAVNQFSEDEPMEISDFLSEQIEEINIELYASSTELGIDESTQQHIFDINESLAEGDTVTALISALEALQEFDVSEYIDAAENLDN